MGVSYSGSGYLLYRVVGGLRDENVQYGVKIA